jgi:hypothetical protein
VKAICLLVMTGCISIAGGTTFNTALNDSPVRRAGASYEVGNLVEIVEDELVGQMFYTKDLAPLGARSEAIGSWGARLTRTQGAGLPGLYVEAAYGQNDDAVQSFARLHMAGAGVAYARHDPRLHGRVWTALRAGVVYYRQHQLTTNSGQVGHFLGIEVGINLGYDVFGPMYGRN